MFTLEQLVKFVLTNRRGNTFNYDELTVAHAILSASKAGTMLYSANEHQQLCGIVIAYNDTKTNTMFIHDILTTEPWVFKTFVSEFKKRWPFHILKGCRGRKEVTYNTPRFCNLVLGGTQ